MTKFKSEHLQKLGEDLLDLMPVFESRKKGAHFRSIFMSLAQVFPEDRDTIYNLFTLQKKEIPTGPRVVKKNRGASSKKPGGCDGCPDPATTISSDNPGPKATRGLYAGSPTGPQEQAQEDKEEQTILYSLEDVVEHFEGSTEAMIAYCQALEIKLPGNIKDPEKIGKRIMVYINANNIEL
jgi:hypothetical protein